MLELDSLFEQFLAYTFDTLTVEEVAAFEKLLSYEDNLLLEYLMGRAIPTDGMIANVIKKIRQSAVPVP